MRRPAQCCSAASRSARPWRPSPAWRALTGYADWSSGGVAHPPPALAVQRAVAKILPLGVMARIAAAQQGPDGAADMRSVGKRTYLAALRELARTDLRPRLGEITAPALVVCGERDKVNQPLSRELAEGIPNAELRIIPGAGHLWNLEQPEVFTALLND